MAEKYQIRLLENIKNLTYNVTNSTENISDSEEESSIQMILLFFGFVVAISCKFYYFKFI